MVLSDLHLGDRDSVLTSLIPGTSDVDTARASPALRGLMACLREILTRHQQRTPTLIANGDFIELAFGGVDQALMTFERFSELALGPQVKLFDEILYVPGNHDHHMWEMARETQYRHSIADTPCSSRLPPARHTTPARREGAVPSLLLNEILKHVDHGQHHAAREGEHREHTVQVMYPNLVLERPALDRAVILHHGHYVEPLYQAFSWARRWAFPWHPPPATLEDIEEENFAWVDFVWSVLGRSGRAGQDVERVFEVIRYEDDLQAYASELARRLAPAIKMPFLPFEWLRRVVLAQVFGRLAHKLQGERTELEAVCTPRTVAGIRSYLYGPSFKQLEDELQRLPEDVTFVMGHTHKPFESMIASPDGARSVPVYNTGGWTVDAKLPSPAFGASVLFLSQDLDIACVRVFNDEEQIVPRFEIRSADGSSGPSTPFQKALAASMERSRRDAPEVWREMAERLGAAVQLRRERLNARYKNVGKRGPIA